jgi:hypothetical protein
MVGGPNHISNSDGLVWVVLVFLETNRDELGCRAAVLHRYRTGRYEGGGGWKGGSGKNIEKGVTMQLLVLLLLVGPVRPYLLLLLLLLLLVRPLDQINNTGSKATAWIPECASPMRAELFPFPY